VNQRTPPDPVHEAEIAIGIMTERINESSDHPFSVQRIVDSADEYGGYEAIISGLITVNASLLQYIEENLKIERADMLRGLGMFFARIEPPNPPLADPPADRKE
jgi:hypothetical protein